MIDYLQLDKITGGVNNKWENNYIYFVQIENTKFVGYNNYMYIFNINRQVLFWVFIIQ